MKYIDGDVLAKVVSPLTHMILDACQQELGLTSNPIPLVIRVHKTALGAATKGHLYGDRPFIGMVIGAPVLDMAIEGHKSAPLLEGLCHECIHVKQLIDGRLTETPTGISWEGKAWPIDEIEAAVSKIDTGISVNQMIAAGGDDKAAYEKYMSFPWEKEAYRLGPQLDQKVRQILEQKLAKKAA